MTHLDATRTLEKYGFKPVHKREVWWLAGRDPISAHIVYDAMSAGYNVILIHYFGPETMVPAFGTGELSTEWALDQQLRDMLMPFSMETLDKFIGRYVVIDISAGKKRGRIAGRSAYGTVVVEYPEEYTGVGPIPAQEWEIERLTLE